jgi:predicted Ser/Thr protein kinase
MSLPYGLREENLPLVGEGSQGKVYLIDERRCIKVYKRPEFLPLELEILLKAAREPQFPKVYEWGADYMIREYVPGIGLKEYLRQNPLTENISHQIAELFLAFERLEFQRLDTRFAHLIVTPEGIVKAIDPANAMRKSGSYPKKFLSLMDKMKCKKLFLKHLRQCYPQLYEKWSKK